MRLDWERMERKSNQVRSSFRKRRPVIWPIINWPTAERKRVQPINYLAYRDISKVSFLYPIWAYWACFAQGSTARHPFISIFLLQHTVKDAPLRGTWLRTLHRWRKEGKYRIGRNPSTYKIRTHDLLIMRRVLYHCGTTTTHIRLIKLLNYHVGTMTELVNCLSA